MITWRGAVSRRLGRASACRTVEATPWRAAWPHDRGGVPQRTVPRGAITRRRASAGPVRAAMAARAGVCAGVGGTEVVTWRGAVSRCGDMAWGLPYRGGYAGALQAACPGGVPQPTAPRGAIMWRRASAGPVRAATA